MSNKWKDRIRYVLIFGFVFILPNLFLLYIGNEDQEKFYERLKVDHQTCLKYAEEDSARERWCDEIKLASITNFNLSDNNFGIYLVMVLFQPILFILLITVWNLRKQIDELKEKSNV